MKINHIAIWVKDLELMKSFYEKYFDCTSGNKYTNKKQFSSYFLTFDCGNRIELMNTPNLKDNNDNDFQLYGYAHIALSVGTKELVNNLTEKLRLDGSPVVGEVRTTGDGYYESVILDPEGNKIEITV